MPTPVFCCGFECGVATSAAHFTISGTASFSTSTVRSGARSMRINPTAANFSSVQNTSNAGGTVGVLRWYVYFASLPLTSTIIGGWDISAQTEGVGFNSVDSKLYPCTDNAGVPTFGSTGFTVTTGVWYLIDLRINVVANPHTIDVQVNGTSLTQLTRAVAASALSNINIGFPHTVVVTADMFVDDVWLSKTSADFPYGAGFVNHFIPTSDGTHTATTTTIVKGTIAAPTGGGNVAGATDVFNWVNGVPLLGGATDNTRLVNQQTTGTTLYAEEIFGPAPGISIPTAAPRAVEVITVDRQATTATGSFETKLNDNGTENAIITRSVVAGSTTDRYARKHYATAPTGGAWTVVSGAGNFNNIRARFGYSGDANPDQYWRGIMIEAEFAPAVAAIPNQIIQVKQAVKRSNTY